MATRSPDVSRSNLPVIPELKSTLPSPETPWNMSSNLFQRVRNQNSNNPFRTCEVLNTDPEFKFILKYFEHQKPQGFGIKRIVCIHNPTHTQIFEATVKNIEQEATNTYFAPQWQQEELKNERAKVIHRWKKQVSQFSPLEIESTARGEDTLVEAKVLPLWHGSSHEKCESVCASGFTFFGKHEFSSGNKGGSTDHGYFGSGIYFTNSAQYAAMYSSEGFLLLNWVTMREPYPVINDVPHPQKGSDMKKLGGKEHYQNYNAHYIPVASIKPDDPKCMNYYPCFKDQPPAWDEFVIFEKAQVLPRFWVELGVDFPKPLPPISPPNEIKKMSQTHIEPISLTSIQPTFAENSVVEKKKASVPSTKPITLQPHLPKPGFSYSADKLAKKKEVQSGARFDLEKISKISCISTLEGNTSAISTFAAFDSEIFATGSHDKALKLWDISQGKCFAILEGHSDRVYALATLPNRILASGSWDHTIKLWDISKSKCIKTLEGHTGPVVSLAVLSGEILISGSNDGTIKLWDVSKQICLETLDANIEEIFHEQAEVTVHRLKLGEKIKYAVNHLAVLSGESFASTSDNVRFWERKGNSFYCTSKIEQTYSVKALASIEGGSHLAIMYDSLGGEGGIELYTSKGKYVRTFFGKDKFKSFSALTALPNGLLVTLSNYGSTFTLWDPSTGKYLHSWSESSHFLAALPSGVIVSESTDGKIKLWK